MDQALRANLSDGLSDGLDKAIIQGGQGLLHSTHLPHHDVTNVTTYALYRSQLAYGRVDGKYASETRDIRIVMGSGHLRPCRCSVPGQQRQPGRSDELA